MGDKVHVLGSDPNAHDIAPAGHLIEACAGSRLQGKFKDRFSFIYEQITKLGKYDGLIFVIDEFRSWQDRHTEGSAAYAEDEEILETLAFVLTFNPHDTVWL